MTDIPAAELDFYNESALLDRLSGGLSGESRQVVFVVGSALTAPTKADGRGVPNVEGVIKLIGSLFEGSNLTEFNNEIASAANPYQAAFKFLIGRRGQKAANGIIKVAVGMARNEPAVSTDAPAYLIGEGTSDEACRGFDKDSSGWFLTPGVDGLGQLIASQPDLFGRMLVTTNFDPLIGASIARYGGNSFRTFLHRDGSLGQADGPGTHLVHLHGYWYGSDTLHTPRQLTQSRPQLRASLSQMIRGNIFVVMAYGGWDDAFTQALVDVIIEDSSFPEVIWCFYQDKPTISADLMAALSPGIDRGRVNLYAGIDVHRFMPKLAALWNEPKDADAAIVSSAALPGAGIALVTGVDASSAFLPPQALEHHTVDKSCESVSESKFDFSRLDRVNQDRPPVVEFLVGRGAQLCSLEEADFKVAFVTGFGGQGKSALVANHFKSSFVKSRYQYAIWRDCREQAAKFEDQILSLIEALGDGEVSSAELAKLTIDELATKFEELTKGLPILIVFDNVDHYVDLENNRLIGAIRHFVERLISLDSKSTVIMTCRPPVVHSEEQYFSLRLAGLSLDDAKELFRLRRASADEELIAKAHILTEGHAFWLDLLAAQVSQRGAEINLGEMLLAISTGTGTVFEAMLRSIWGSLRVREQVVLQALAETLRPTNVLELADYVRFKFNYKTVSKAIQIVKGLNLVVLKDDLVGGEAFELHPLIRTFIQGKFQRKERRPFIDAIYQSYIAFFGLHRVQLKSNPKTQTVLKWLEGAELCVNAERYPEALECLHDVAGPVRMQEPPGEFVRIAGRLFENGLSHFVNIMHFEEVFEVYTVLLVHVGDVGAASDALEDYLETIEGKSARYIQYCNMQCYLYWMTENFDIAVKWGQEGEDLRISSNVDTVFTSAHNLALAQRDSGAVDKALVYFLMGVSMDEVLDPKLLDADRGGAFYGNIGRCLHLMGQVDSAITCYKKSAKLLQTRLYDSNVENQAYIRQWFGELLKRRGDVENSIIFMEAAFAKWKVVSIPKAEKVKRDLYAEYPEWVMPLDFAASERRAVAWIMA